MQQEKTCDIQSLGNFFFMCVDSSRAADSDSDARDLKDTRDTEGDTKDAKGSVQAAESAGQVTQVKSKGRAQGGV